MQLVLGDDNLAFGGWNFGFRDEHFGDKDGAGRGHDDGGQQMPWLDSLGDVHGHDAAGDVGHAAGHDDHQFAARGFGEERPDGERGFGLAHEDGGGHVHALRAGDAHGLEHDPGHGADDDLHDAYVVEHGEKGGDKDDGGQNLEGEDGAQRTIGQAQSSAEEDFGAGIGGGEHGFHHVPGPGHELLSVVEAQHEKGKDQLQTQSPGDGAPADMFAVG